MLSLSLGVSLPLSFLAAVQGAPPAKNSYLFLISLTLFLSCLAFTVSSPLLFYVLVELATLAVSVLALGWASRTRRYFAGRLLFSYSTVAAAPLLFSISQICFYSGILQQDYTPAFGEFSPGGQSALFLGLSFPFLVKTPIVPFHYWLLEAHVESHTSVSIILAGIFLKFGFYGLSAFVLPLKLEIFYPLRSIILGSIAFSSIYISASALFQYDLKRIVAYSSVIHMSFSTGVLVCDSEWSLVSAWLGNLAHGIYSPCLFYCVGHLYRYLGTRVLFHFGGFSGLCPRLNTVFLLLILSASAFPGTLQFISELYGVVCAWNLSPFFALTLAVSPFLSAFYLFWTYGRLVGGPYVFQSVFPDLSIVETLTMGLYGILGLVSGFLIFPFVNRFPLFIYGY